MIIMIAMMIYVVTTTTNLRINLTLTPGADCMTGPRLRLSPSAIKSKTVFGFQNLLALVATRRHSAASSAQSG
jgi:hypothetical protein